MVTQTDTLRRALRAIDELQHELDVARAGGPLDIAIVSAGCRFPGGVSDLDSYWRLLDSGKHVCGPVPPDRFIDLSRHYDRDVDVPGKMNCADAAWVDDVFLFDAEFFNISDREAASMDPQQRMLLEVTWEALENAGIPPESLRNSQTGVFVGVMNNDYGRSFVTPSDLRGIDAYYFTGNSFSFAGGRLSYVLGLRGPCISLDSACASSLVSVHLACQSLRRGECSIALAGGVSLMLGPQLGVVLSKARVLAPDGRSKAFDARADGIGRGEGAGIVVLKRLADAERDGDPILAVIRGSATNHGGASLGITVPNGPAQEELIRHALADARVEPEAIDYVEAHGTGTPVGDPIEATAIGDVLAGPARARPLWIGSVKTNFGHLDSAAGMAGLLKVLVAMQRGVLPATVGFETPSPAIEWDRLNLRVPTQSMPWPSREPGATGLAGVSAFGMSGVNAHLVVEGRVPREDEDGAPVAPLVLTMSGKTAQATVELGRRYLSCLQGPDLVPLTAFCRTAALGRAPKRHRMAVTGSDREQLMAALEQRLRVAPRRAESDVARIFVFTGQGSQWSAMGRELLARDEVFRATIARCSAVLDAMLERSLVELLSTADAAVLAQTCNAQPAIFAMQVGLVETWRARGIEPSLVVGHSVGEIAAACAAGILDLESACRLVAVRARLMDETTGRGRMLLVRAGRERIESLIGGVAVDIAAENSGDATVLSGSPEDIQRIDCIAGEAGLVTRDLGVDCAFHSRQMSEPAAALQAELARWLKPRPAAIPIVSTVTGRLVGADALDAGYWASNVRDRVRFATAIASACRADRRPMAFLEIGPHAALGADIGGLLSEADGVTQYVASMRRERDALAELSAAAATLYEFGAAVAFEPWFPKLPAVPLPMYPWQRKDHRPLYEPETSETVRLATSDPLRPAKVAMAVRSEITAWTTRISCESVPWLRDHRVQGQIFVPGTAVLEMMTGCATEAFVGCEIQALHFEEALVVAERGSRDVQVIADSRTREVTLWSRPAGVDGDWTQHASSVASEPAHRSPTLRSFASLQEVDTDVLEEIRQRCPNHRTRAQHLHAMVELGMNYGPAFSAVAEVWRGEGEALARLEHPAGLGESSARVHPAVLDACLQVTAAAVPERKDVAMLPAGIGHVVWYEVAERITYCHAQLHAANEDSARCDLRLMGKKGRLIAELRDVELRRTRRDTASIGFLVHEWVRLEEPVQPRPRAGSSWLLVSEDGDQTGLAPALVQAGATVTQRMPKDLVELPPGSFDGIILAIDLAAEHPAQTLRTVHELIQAQFDDARIRDVVIVTRGVLAVASDAPGWGSAVLHGYARVLEHERPSWSVGVVDFDPGAPLEEQRSLTKLAISHVGTESVVVVRRGQAWGNRLTDGHARDVDPLEPVVRRDFVVREDGMYLISGGRGGIGLVCARWLVGRGARHIVLLGRSAPSADVRAVVAELECEGATVELPELDVADAHVLGDWLSSHTDASVRGIIHAAGLLDDGTIPELRWDSFERVVRPKTDGLRALLMAVPIEDLDFALLFSSATSLLGNGGQANYAAANAALDAAANHFAARGYPVRVINWGAWSEVGMLRSDARAAEHLERQGFRGMSNDEAMRALDRVLETPRVQVGIIALEPARYAQAQPALARKTRMSTWLGAFVEEPLSERRLQEELDRLAPAKRLGHLESYVASCLGAVLRRTEAIALDVSFDQLGIDSLMAVEIKNRIESDLRMSFSVGTLWSHPSVGALSAYLLHRLGLDVQECVPASAPTDDAVAQHVGELLTRLRARGAKGEA